MPRPGPRKYAPLTTYLASLVGAEVTLTLGEIEAIIGAPLPTGARRRSWWVNAPRYLTAVVWLRAGWRVTPDGLWGRSPSVTFVRQPSEPTA